MPNKDSAKKFMRVTSRHNSLNNKFKKDLNSELKKMRKLISEKKSADAKNAFPLLQKNLDKAAKKGIIEKNTANRTKSRLVAQIKKIS